MIAKQSPAQSPATKDQSCCSSHTMKFILLSAAVLIVLGGDVSSEVVAADREEAVAANIEGLWPPQASANEDSEILSIIEAIAPNIRDVARRGFPDPLIGHDRILQLINTFRQYASTFVKTIRVSQRFIEALTRQNYGYPQRFQTGEYPTRIYDDPPTHVATPNICPTYYHARLPFNYYDHNINCYFEQNITNPYTITPKHDWYKLDEKYNINKN